ncbi:MAG: sugar phosphate isomerase/epimerase [Acidobacteriota bacterium]|nr:sugar phosphate isomerase/epimerase [Acidobacteriota bacterium]
MNRKLSRREFLGSAAALGAGASILGKTASLLAAEPHLEFPTEPRQRLSVTSYPFRAYIESPTNHARDKSKPGMDLKEFAAMVAQKFGVYNINPLSNHLSSTEPDYLDAFRAAVEKAGSHLVGLGLGGYQFWDPDQGVRAAAVASSKKWIDIALVLGSPSVRQHLRGSHRTAPNLDLAAASLGRLADYGAKKNIVVNLENDSPVNENPFFIVKVIEKVSNPYLRALPDFGNSIRGQDAAYNQRAVTAMFKHVFNMSHVKDALRGEGGKIYKIDVAKLFAIARASGYRGYFSMEWDTGAGLDPYQGTQRLIQESIKYM